MPSIRLIVILAFLAASGALVPVGNVGVHAKLYADDNLGHYEPRERDLPMMKAKRPC